MSDVIGLTAEERNIVTMTQSLTNQVGAVLKKRKISDGAGFGSGFAVTPTSIRDRDVLTVIRDQLIKIEALMVTKLGYESFLPSAYAIIDEEGEVEKRIPLLMRSGKAVKTIDNPAFAAWQLDRGRQSQVLTMAQFSLWEEENPKPQETIERENPSYGRCYWSIPDEDVGKLHTGMSRVMHDGSYEKVKGAQRGKKQEWTGFMWFTQSETVSSGTFATWFPLLRWMTQDGDGYKCDLTVEPWLPERFIDKYYNNRSVLFKTLWIGMLSAHKNDAVTVVVDADDDDIGNNGDTNMLATTVTGNT